MVEVGYVLDDRLIIPEDIKNMTKQERKEEIARLERNLKINNNNQNSNLKAV